MSQLDVVTIINSPTDSQLDQMVQLTVAAFENDQLTNAMTGGIHSLKVELYRLLFRTAALEGRILVICKNEGVLPKIISVGVCFGPGTDFLGSEAQRALGADEFFAKLPKETKKWYDEVNGPLSKKLVKETIGQKTITDNWWIDCMATMASEQRKGHATAILNEIRRTAAAENKIVALNAISATNVAFYEQNGFKVIGSAERPSPFGTWISTIMTTVQTKDK